VTTGSHIVRRATGDDRAAIEALIARSVRGLMGGDYTPPQLEAALEHVFLLDSELLADGSYFVVEQSGSLLASGGWSRWRKRFGGDGFAEESPLLDPTVEAARIRAFFVDPDHARRGLGSALLEVCDDAAAQAGFRRLELVATLPGQRLFARKGFQALESFSVELPGGLKLPVVRMERPIADRPMQRSGHPGPSTQ
jgi:GNAT superfamily N-acetyltransferase